MQQLQIAEKQLHNYYACFYTVIYGAGLDFFLYLCRLKIELRACSLAKKIGYNI